MKNKSIAFIAIGALFSLYSCAPVYKCGDEKPAGGIQGSNRLLDVVNERDELCEMVEIKDQENAYLIKTNQQLEITNDSLTRKNREIAGDLVDLKDDFSQLKDKHAQLQTDHLNLSERFSSAITNNLNQGHLFDERIKEKERRLAEKENDLLARERKINELEAEIAKQDANAKRLDRLLREALLGFDADELSIEIKNGKVYVSMSDKLMFQSGKSDVQAKGKEALKVLADVLKKNPEFQILVEGHTDNVPIKTATYKDNWDLSVARATSMVRLLQETHDISAERLTASGRGEYEPKASNSTATGRAKNRRTEIILSPDLSEVMNYLGK